MKRIFFILIVSILGAIGFYFLWEINHPPVVKAWDLVLEESVLVYEHKKNATNDYADIVLSLLPDSIPKDILNANEFLVSIHVTGKEDLGAILYLAGSPEVEKKISSALKSIPSSKERNFEGYRITEVANPGQKILSAVIIDHVFVISQTSFLIEDVIRLAKAREKQNFIKDNKTLFQFSSMDPGGGNAYLNLSRISKFSMLFLTGQDSNPILDRFAKSGVVEMKWEKQALLLSGFAVDSMATGLSILSLFNQQRPVPLTLHRITSNRTGLLVHYGISDFNAWTEDRLAFCKAAHMQVADSITNLERDHGFDAKAFYRALGDEMGICKDGIFAQEMFIVKLRNPSVVLNQLKKLRRERRADALAFETYSHYQINMLDVPSLPVAMFWPLNERKMNYYLVADNYLIFSEDLDDMKSFVRDMEAESTWGKSTEWNQFLSTSSETNLGIIFDALNWWPSLRNRLNLKWRSIGDSTRFLDLSRGSFQFSRLEKHYYFNGVLRFNPKHLRTPLAPKEKYREISVPQTITSPLTVVRNHNTGSYELLTQDEGNNLLLFSAGLKSIFSVALDGKIKSEIHQIDYYQNRKLQYLFATGRSIYLIDRLGNPVKGFPLRISAKDQIHFLTLIDYDNSKNYRFLVSDTRGTITAYDREGKLLPGWKVIELNKELWVAPRAVRARGKDYIVAITQEATLNVFNRRGEPVKGFPVNLPWKPGGDWVFEKLGNQEVITMVSEDGVMAQIDLKGNTISSNNLVKSLAVSTFALVPSPEGSSYVISRIDQNKLTVLNSRGEVIFESENPGAYEQYLSYFTLGRGRLLFAFTDPQQEFTYFFDEKGTPVFSQPLENREKPSILVEKSGDIYFFGVSKNKIRSYHPK